MKVQILIFFYYSSDTLKKLTQAHTIARYAGSKFMYGERDPKDDVTVYNKINYSLNK